MSTTFTGKIGSTLTFCGLPDIQLRAQYAASTWYFTGRTAPQQTLSLKEVWNNLLPEVAMPLDMDVRLSNMGVHFSFNTSASEQRGYTLTLEATVEANLTSGDDFQASMQLDKLRLEVQRTGNDATRTNVALHLHGNANINDFLVLPQFWFDFVYSHNPEQNASTWRAGGELHALAFDRLLTFKADANASPEAQGLSFEYAASNPVLHAMHLNRIDGAEAAELLTALNGGTPPALDQLEIQKLPADCAPLLAAFSPEAQAATLQVIARVRNAAGPLVQIPDLLHPGKHVCSISPTHFKLHVAFANKRLTEANLSITSDLVLYNNLLGGGELLRINQGTLSTGYNREKERFFLEYKSEQTNIQPLQLVGMVPGIRELLLTSFGETEAQCPKATAFMNMLQVRPMAFSFAKERAQWQLSGGVRLALTNALQTVDPALYGFLEELFPKSGDVRYLQGQLSYNSKDGLFFVLYNNSGLQVPDFLHEAVKQLDAEWKAQLKADTGLDLDRALNLGPSFVLLERIRLQLAKKVKVDFRVGVGLPANLNKVLFSEGHPLQGLIQTWDREKFDKAWREREARTGPVDFDEELPDDNLLRASLEFGSDGLSGQLEKFSFINWDLLLQQFEGLLKEESNALVLNLNALANEPRTDLLRLQIEKPRFKLDLASSTFTLGGGVKLLSDTIRIPVRSFARKLINLLPDGSFDIEALRTASGLLADTIELRSMRFYDADTGKLTLNEIQDFVRQFLAEGLQDFELFPREVLQELEKHSDKLTQLFPTRLLEFLSVDIPAGFSFLVEVPADKTVAIAFEVPEPTEAQRAAGYKGYLQLLFPDPPNPLPIFLNGIRLKKVGFGSALGNQAFRVDLHTEIASFRLTDLVGGVGLGIWRQLAKDDARAQHMIPNAAEMGTVAYIHNLLLIVIPHTKVPLPVPIFYDRLGSYHAGLEGSVSEFNIRLPRPRINMVELLRALGDVKRYVTEENFALPVPGYGKARAANEPITDTLLPVFQAGPVVLELPGYVGYQKHQDGSRTRIGLGFRDIKALDPRDLAGLIGNVGKFSVLGLVKNQSLRIPIDAENSAYPLSYLVRFLPENQRIGSADIVLFDRLETHFVWALSTPGEFSARVWPLVIQKEQEQGRGAGGNQGWSSGALQEILPNSEQWTNDQDGVVTFLKGGLSVGNNLYLDMVVANALTVGSGIATGFAMRAQLAGIFDMQLKGHAQIDVTAEQKLRIGGYVHLLLMERVPVLKGALSIGIGSNSHITFSGLLDLFPDELFPERSPVQLYSGTGKGQKAPLMATIGQRGIAMGALTEQGEVVPGGFHLEIGPFHLGGTTLLVVNETRAVWEVTLMCYGTELSFSTRFEGVAGAVEMRQKIAANKPIELGRLLRVSGANPADPPTGSLLLTYRGQSLFPELTHFHLDGVVAIGSLRASASIAQTIHGFSADLFTDLGILQSRLTLSGSSFAEATSFALNGHVSLLADAVRIDVATHYSNQPEERFHGSGKLTFWGKERMSLTLDAGDRHGAFYLAASGTLDLLYVPNVMRLYTGTATELGPISGELSAERMLLQGGLHFHLGPLQLDGNVDWKIEANVLSLKGAMSFTAGVLANGSIQYGLEKQGDLFKLNGTAGGGIFIAPGLELGAQSTLLIELNEATSAVETFRLSGGITLLGVGSSYTLNIGPQHFELTSTLKTPLAEFGFRAASSNLADVNAIRVAGSANLDAVNNIIGGLFSAGAARAELDRRINSLTNGRQRLQGTQTDVNERKRKLDFIRAMDQGWRHNLDPGLYNNCVPPLHNVVYWSVPRFPIPVARYNGHQVNEVRQYWQYKAQLGLPTNDPPKLDIGRFLSAALDLLNRTVAALGQQALNDFRNVVNGLHGVLSEHILRGLNIDTTDINRLNEAFNNGINAINQEITNLERLNDQLIHNPLVLVEELSFENQPVQIFQNNTVEARVRLKILGQHQHTVTVHLNLLDPADALRKTIEGLIPAELRIFG